MASMRFKKATIEKWHTHFLCNMYWPDLKCFDNLCCPFINLCFQNDSSMTSLGDHGSQSKAVLQLYMKSCSDHLEKKIIKIICILFESILLLILLLILSREEEQNKKNLWEMKRTPVKDLDLITEWLENGWVSRDARPRVMLWNQGGLEWIDLVMSHNRYLYLHNICIVYFCIPYL